jgi:hypothetical protein
MTITADIDRLVELLREREEHDPLTSRFAYLSGQIEELARGNGISEIDLELARQAVARSPIEVTR